MDTVIVVQNRGDRKTTGKGTVQIDTLRRWHRSLITLLHKERYSINLENSDP